MENITLKAGEKLIVQTEHYGISLVVEAAGKTLTVRHGVGNEATITLGEGTMVVRSLQVFRGGHG